MSEHENWNDDYDCLDRNQNVCISSSSNNSVSEDISPKDSVEKLFKNFPKRKDKKTEEVEIAVKKYQKLSKCIQYTDKKASQESIDEVKYSLYVRTSCETEPKIMIETLDNVIKNMVVGRYKFKEATCGIIAVLYDYTDVERILKLDLANVFGSPVQVANLSNKERRFSKCLIFKDIPWCIPIPELTKVFENQRIHVGDITRQKTHVKVEILNSCHFDRLLQEGLNFYNCTIFQALLDTECNRFEHSNSDIVQCYKCQGFWHTANHCKQSTRCVRCGENHDVESCTRPKDSPTCCNCGGSHHAAYKQCPIKLQLIESIKIAFTLANQPKSPVLN